MTWTKPSSGGTSAVIGPTLNLDIGLRKWRATKAKLDAGWTGIIDLVAAGDSITEGANVTGGTFTDFLTKGFAGRVRTALATKYGDVGMGFVPSFFPNTAGPTKAWTYTGTWSQGSYGIAKLCYKSTTVGDTATFQFSGTGVQFVVIQSPTVGQFQAYVDGAAAANFGATNAGGLICSKYSITGLTDGAHTLTIKCSQAAGVYIVGASAISSGLKGVRVHTCAKGGATSTDFMNQDNLQAAFDMWSPTLSMIAIHTNNYSAQTPLATFKSEMQTIISRALQFGDVLLIATGPRNIGGSIPQSSYIQTLRDLAAANNIAYLSIWDRWGSDYNVSNNAGLFQDSVHPSDYGHADYANAIMSILMS